MEAQLGSRRASAVGSKTDGAAREARRKRTVELARLALALDAHDPQRTLRRGYALVQSRTGDAIGSAAAARQAREVLLRFADDSVEADVRTDQ